MKKIFIVLICALLLPLSVQASSGTEEKGSLSLYYEQGAATFSIYRVADFSETGKFKITDSFKKYPVKFDDLDTDGWKKLADTLSGYVSRDKISYVRRVKTDTSGKYEWKEIPKGLYLVIGEMTKDEKYTYTPMPFLITVPGRDVTGKWDLSMEAAVKYEREERLEATKRVVKTWKGDANKNVRPSEITVQLLKDDKVFDTVKLNQKNNWRYTWEKLPLGYTWKVVEKDVPDEYTVTSTQSSDRFVLTNTYKEKPKDNEKDKDNKKETKTEKKEKEKLPQAGQIWWPVPILVTCGIAAFGIGWLKRKKWDDFYGES